MKLHRVVMFAAFALGACTTEKIQYVTRPPFNPGPDSAAGFLGYFTVSERQTNCGNCHSGTQLLWVGTKHAHAWANLTNAVGPTPPAYCANCHTTNQNGNIVPDTQNAGYLKIKDSAYYDVQCESCHGPGFVHAGNPSLGNVPLARIGIPTDTIVADTSPTCAACHKGAHDPFMEQWSQSPHSGTVKDVITSYMTNPANYASCMACHEGRSTLKAWGVSTNYVEKNDPINLTTAMPVTCAVCHNPHSDANAGQLRFPIDDPDPTNNLCMKCHLRRVEPPTSTSSPPRGPHAPQGGVLLGSAGWWPQTRDTITATHGNVLANARLCAGCHVTPFDVTDPATGSFVFHSVGHLFKPTPCLDAKGLPTGADCLRPGDPGYVSGSRAFTGCQAAGCHNSVTQAENAFAANRAAVAALADALWKDNDGSQVLVRYNTTTKAWQSYEPGATGLLAQIADTDAVKPNTGYNYGDGVISAPEGALFNVQLVGEGRYANGDGSFAAHNPLLAQTLLANSINALKAQYPYLIVPAPVQLLMADVQRKAAAYRAARLGAERVSGR